MECIKCGHEIMAGAAFCPYCGEKVAEGTPGADQPLYLAEVKGLLKSGTLAVYRDRVEFATSNVQKTVFNYSALVAVKKGLDRIIFLTEDGRSESCSVNRKNIHEAFLYIDKASQPYIEKRKSRLLEQGIRYSVVSGQGLATGILNILDDRVEFKGKSGQAEPLSFREVKDVGLSMGGLEFFLYDGKTKGFSLDKELREEVLLFLKKAIQPFIEARKAELLARGIYFSCLSSRSSDSGTLDVREDRVDYTARSGQQESVFFRDVRAAALSAGMLELGLTNGTTRSFGVERDVQGPVLAFVEQAIQPYVEKRTAGFEVSFGEDERIEVNPERKVFHILRQGGNEITEERPLEDVIKCERIEGRMKDSAIGGVLSGGMSILNSAAGAVGVQGVPTGDELMSYVGVVLTIRMDGGTREERVRFGDFPLGAGRTSKKYLQCGEAVGAFMDHLATACPACELVIPAPPEEGEETPEPPAVTAPVEEPPKSAETAEERDHFGIIKYIEGVSRFIGECGTPMTIAMQGSWGGGRNSIMKLLLENLEENRRGELVYFNTWQFSQFDLGEQLPLVVGNRLISQLGGMNNTATKDRAIKVAKGLINITSGFISQGSSDGQNLMDAIFKDNSTDTLEKTVKTFAQLVRKRAEAGSGKVVVLVDDLDQLAPVKGVELLEAMRHFFDCEGCVFVVAVDYNAVLRGAKERYGDHFDESKGKSLFNKIFQVSFRVPTSGYNIQNYVKDKLEHIQIKVEDEAELNAYAELIRHSVGVEPKTMDRLFNSFLLLKTMTGEELYSNKDRRLMLFALLCMQTQFREGYEYLVRAKDQVTPDFLNRFFGGEEGALEGVGLSPEEKTGFRDFGRVFCGVIDADRAAGISEAECDIFEEVLEVSSITFQ